MSDLTVKYRATGGVDYQFTFEWRPRDSSWRIYIDQQPAYRGRPEGAHPTHRYGLPGRPWICWTTAIGSYQDARAIAMQWAERTQRYITSGASIDEPIETPTLTDRSSHAALSETALRTRATASATPPQPTNNDGLLRRLLQRLG